MITGRPTWDIMAFAFFLVVSAGFWLMQKLDDTFETDIVVPLELVGLPKGAIITSPLPNSVTITVQDRGANLLHYIRQSDDDRQSIKLDFAQYYNGSMTAKVAVPITDVQRSFQQQMLSSTLIKMIRPNKLEFHYNRGVSKVLPVKFVGQVTTRSENYLKSLTFKPDSVTVYAPLGILDTLKYAYTSRMDAENLSKTQDFPLGFPKISGVKVVPEIVKMTANVDYYTEQTVKVPVVGVNFPGNVALKTFPAMATIKYRVGASNARSVSAKNFVIAATYEELLHTQGSKFRLQLKSKPPGVSRVQIQPKEVEFLLEHTSGAALPPQPAIRND